MFLSTLPFPGDSQNVLLQKIAQSLGAQITAGDTSPVLLSKIAAIVAGLGGAGSSAFVEVTGDTMTGALAIAGSANTVQLKVTGNSTQTSNLLEIWKQGETSGVTVDNNGSIAQFAYLANTSSNCRHDFNRRGTTGDINAALVNGTAIGDTRFLGWDGSAYGVGGILRWVTNETWTTGAHGAQLQIFATTPTTTTNTNVAKLDTTAFDLVNGCAYRLKGVALHNPLSVYATGTVYTLTATPAAVDFGTTDPTITLNAVGTYAIRARVKVALNGATFAANRTLTVKLRRTNNTAADVADSSTTYVVPITTTITNTLAVIELPEVLYTTANTNDVLTIFADISVTPSAGSISIDEASIVAVRLS